MGLERKSSTGDNAIYLTVRTSTDSKGRKRAVLAQRVPQGTPGAVQVFKADGTPATNKEGDTVWRLEYDSITGVITKVAKHDADFGDGKGQSYCRVTITDDGQDFVLDLDRGDRYWADFLMRLPNMKLGAAVTLLPYNIMDEQGKYNMGVSMRQNGDKVERKWTAANGYAGGPPKAIYDEDEGEWKFGKRNKWLEDNVLDAVAAQLA